MIQPKRTPPRQRQHIGRMRVIASVSSLMLAGLVACAHSPAPQALPPAPKEVAVVNTLETYPELTPQEIGRRFLRLVDSLKSFDELSHERVRAIMDMPMVHVEKDHGSFLIMDLPESGWRYIFTYSIDPRREYRNVRYQFNNENQIADMGPVCALDFNAYEAELKRIGFGSGPTSYDELGRLVALQYLRNNVRVQIIPRREADTPDAKLRHACVESISIHAFGP